MNRQEFIRILGSTLAGLAIGDSYLGSPALADENLNTAKFSENRYQIFIPYRFAKLGGEVDLLLRSGDFLSLKVPARAQDGSVLKVKSKRLQPMDIEVTIHTLYSAQNRNSYELYATIDRADVVSPPEVQYRCRRVYEQVEEGQLVQDWAALDLLDYIAESSKLPEDWIRVYRIASQSARVTAVGSYVLQALDRSKLEGRETRKLLATLACVRDLNPPPDYVTLKDLDALVTSSSLPESLKREYQIASFRSRAIAVDAEIINLLEFSFPPDGEQFQKYLKAYQAIRDGQRYSDLAILQVLDSLILTGSFPEEPEQALTVSETAKTVYWLARSRFFDVDSDPSGSELAIAEIIANDSEPVLQDLSVDAQQLNKLYRNIMQVFADKKTESERQNFQDDIVGDLALLKALDRFMESTTLIPQAQKNAYLIARTLWVGQTLEFQASSAEDHILQGLEGSGSVVPDAAFAALSVLGTEAGTGVTISSLTGGAALNASLAVLGGGSVATGGLGMLGGLAVVTGGSALIGAAGLVSVALLAQMDRRALGDLGIAGTLGTLTSLTTALLVWTAASSLASASGLSGAAAISAAIASLGGVSVMTGGVTLIAFGTGWIVYQVRKEQSHNRQVLRNLEARLYTILNIDSDIKLVRELLSYLPEVSASIQKQQEDNDRVSLLAEADVYLAPKIPIDRLSGAIEFFGSNLSGQCILMLIDTSRWDDGRRGIILTVGGILWSSRSSKPKFSSYQQLNWTNVSEISTLIDDDRDSGRILHFLVKLIEQPPFTEAL